MIVSIYLLLKNKPVLASCFVTLALSIKAGVILLLPAFLGSIQLNFGTRSLLKSIVIIVGFQVLISLPFVLGDSTVSDYIVRSKLTGAGRNGIAYSAEFWDYMASHKSLTIFWKYTEENFYYARNGLSYWCMRCLLVLNIYHFFIRKNALVGCLNNLMSFLKMNPDIEAIELAGLKGDKQRR